MTAHVHSALDEPLTASSQAASSRKHTLFVLALAFTLRLLVDLAILTRYPHGWLFGRGIEMGLLAKSLLAGLGLSSPFGGSTGPSAFIAPGYPLLVALVFRVFGIESTLSAAVILLAHTALNVLTVWLIFHIGRKLFSPTAALVSSLVWACSLPLLWMPSIFWDTSLSAFALLGALAFALHFRRQASLPVWLSLGAGVALAGLINPALLPTLLAILLWLATQQTAHGFRNVACALLALCLVFSPWPLRNERVFHKFIPTRTTVGFELWMGNHPGSSGFLEESLFPMYNPGELADYNRLGEVPYTDGKSAAARTWITAHPATFTSLTARRILRFWTGTGTRGGSLLFTLHASLTTLFGLATLVLLFRSRRRAVAVLFALPLLIFPLPYYITHAEFRYRLVLDPVMTALAGYSLVLLWQRLTSRPESLISEPLPTRTEHQSLA